MNQSTAPSSSKLQSKADKQPAYKRIQAYILECIEKERLKPGEQISTEMELAEQFGVSRMTVNKAIVGLSEQNVLTRIAGKGTFVTKQNAELPLMQVIDFSEEVQLRGHNYEAHIIAHDIIPAYDDIALQLGVANGELVAFCEVLHLDNNTPLILESRYINIAYADNFMAQDFTSITPTAYLLNNTPLHEVEHTVVAISATQSMSEQLKIAENMPCLQITRRTWSADTLVSYTHLLTAGNRYSLRSRYRVS